MGLSLASCDKSGDEDKSALVIPEREEKVFVTDQASVAGNNLFLWNEGNGCQLQVNTQGGKVGTKEWLKPTASCYFIKSPGSQNVQVFQQDKTTRIVAVVGTSVVTKGDSGNQRCGREVQGLIVNSRGKVRASDRILSGSVYCADKGLDNFQYSLFHGS